MQLVNVSGTWRIGRATSSLKRCGHVIRAVRLHVLICPACTPYFFANSERVSSSRIASSATLALKSGAWFFLFVILDHFFHQSIQLHKWSEIPRPPLKVRSRGRHSLYFAQGHNRIHTAKRKGIAQSTLYKSVTSFVRHNIKCAFWVGLFIADCWGDDPVAKCHNAG